MIPEEMFFLGGGQQFGFDILFLSDINEGG
jgi:hypothetical protein